MAAPRNRWASQASQDALLKFAPKRSALAEALQNARQEYGSAVQAGKSTATLSSRAAAQALPQIQQIYSKANAAQQAGATLVSSDLAGATGANPNYKAGEAGEVQQQLANLLGARSRDESMLAKAGTAAAAGAQFNELSARQTLQKAVAGILGKSQTTAQEQGAFAETETEKLAHEAEKAEQSERQSERSADTSRTNSKESNAGAERRSERSAASKTLPGGAKPQTSDKQGAAAAAIRQLETHVRTLWKTHTPQQIYAELTTEHPASKENVVKRDENGKPITKVGKEGKREYEYEAVTYPTIKPANALFAQAAIDSAFKYGRVSAGTLAKLHAQGYSIKQLNLGPPSSSSVSSAPSTPAGRANEYRQR